MNAPTLTVSVTRDRYGYWQCAAVVNGYRVWRAYAGYSRRAAVQMFRRDVAAAQSGKVSA